MMKSSLPGLGFRLAGAVALSAALASTAAADTAVAVTADGRLVSFDTSAPGTLLTSVAVTGLQAAETVAGIDFRPLSGGLYALGSTGRLYTIDRATGAATQVGTGVFAPALSGASFGFDFNPVVDRIRVVSDANQNLRLDPATGLIVDGDGVLVGTQTDTDVAFAAADANFGTDPVLVASAYDRSVPGASATTLFGIDANLDVLVRQGGVDALPDSPGTGMLHTIGSLGVNTTNAAHLDIAGTNAFAVLTLQVSTTSNLYTVNLTTGAATLVGTIGGGSVVNGFAIATQRFVAVTAADALVTFAADAPGVPTTAVPVTGLFPLDTIKGIDVRPGNGRVYLLGSLGYLYTVDPATGVATVVGGLFAVTPTGTDWGVDFNPAADRFRIVTDADENFRVNPDTGAIVDGDTVAGGTQFDTALTFAVADPNAAANPNVAAAAYDNNTSGAATTTLYGIDTNLDILVRQGSVGGTPTSPNSGMLTTVGQLGFDTTASASFDIPVGSATAYAALTGQAAIESALYTVNLATGAATLVGTIGAGSTLHGMTALPIVVGPAAQAPIPAVALYGLTTTNALVSFQSDTPATASAPIPITGLQGGEDILAIDVRPSDHVLYGVSSQSRLYGINHTTGAAVLVGAGPFTPPLDGAQFGIDFNPVVDRLRVVSDADQNFRLDPVTGAVAATDVNLAFAGADPHAASNPGVTALAYDRNLSTSPATTAYAIDTDLDILVRLGSVDGTPNPPNGGQLTTVGPLGVDTTAVAGFEIVPTTDAAFAVLTVGGVSRLHLLDLASGTATLVGDVGTGLSVRGLSIAPTADPVAPPAPEPLTAKSLSLKMSFCGSGKDSVSVSGSVEPLTGTVLGKVVIVDVGGFIEPFTLDSKGKGANGDDKFSIGTKPKNGVVTFNLSIKKEDLSDEFADENITGDADVKNAPRQILVRLRFDGNEHEVVVPILYTAKAEHSGSAKIQK